MRINRITETQSNTNCKINKNKQVQTDVSNNERNVTDILKIFPVPFLGTPRVSKEMSRFLKANEKIIPTTVKLYLESLKDKFSVTPLQAQREAYANLVLAKSIEDVQNLFSEEELFIYLNPIEKTKATSGLLGIYREFKDIFENGILRSGEDFVVYLVKKIFIEAKTKQEINDDLEIDLIPDIKNEFKRKYNDNDYITSSIYKSLGIYTPNVSYQNSLRFTREGYSDSFGLKVSEALLKKWNSYSEEEKLEKLSKMCAGRDEWWNSLPYEKKLELAAGVDSEDDVYSNYKQYVKANRKVTTRDEEDIPEYLRTIPKKRYKIGSNIKNKDIFILWMKRNLEKYYASLTELEKEIISVKRSKRCAQIWQEMTPEAKTEYINSIRTGLEPLRYAMIDAWNHSTDLIRALSKFLKEQQILKPIDLLYDTDEFKDFQSRVMTEFWAANKDLAADFGAQIKYSHQKIEDAIKSGKFEDLKKEINSERDERIKILTKEYQAEEEKIKKIEEEKIQAKEASLPKEEIDYRKEFTELYKKSIDKYGILPQSYTNEMVEIFLDRFPKDIITRYANALKSGESVPSDVMNYVKKEQEKHDLPRIERMQRALEAAIATEMTSKQSRHALFLLDINTLIMLLNRRYSDSSEPKEKRINIDRIVRLYNEYDRDLSENDLNTIANTYFSAERELTKGEKDLFESYLNSYGRSLLILFSDKSAYSDAIKDHFNEKFLKLMPQTIRKLIYPYIQTQSDIREEKEIGNMTALIYKRFKYIADDILKIYTTNLAYAIRMDRRENHSQNWLKKFTNIFSTKASYDAGQAFPNIVKSILPNDEKLKFMAIEQAMADELYRVTKNKDIYAKRFEQLLNFYDMMLIVGKHDKEVKLYDENGTLLLSVKEKPSIKNIQSRYLKYVNSLNASKELFSSDNEINMQKLLYCLNPNEENRLKNDYIIKRILPYFNTEIDNIPSEEALSSNENQYKKDFFLQFQSNMNKDNILPSNYVYEMCGIILNTFPKEFIERYTDALAQNKEIPKDILATLQKEANKNNNPRLARMQRALEVAIASELVNKGGNPIFFEMMVDSLTSILSKRLKTPNLPKESKIDLNMIKMIYNSFQEDLSQEEIDDIANRYFAYKDSSSLSNEEKDRILKDYIKEYGKSAQIIFSNKKPLGAGIREALNNKFLKLMPSRVTDVAIPLLKTSEDFSDEYKIVNAQKQIAKRFYFIPPKALETYTQEVATSIRVYRQPEASEKDREIFSLDNVKSEICNKKIASDGGVSILRIPKYSMSTSSKLQLLAAEQAMADELCRISGNDIVYKYEIEDLATWFEMVNSIKGKNSRMEITCSDGKTFEVKQKPNLRNLSVKFLQYMNDIETSEDLYLENGEIDKEELLYILNPEEDKPQKDKVVNERINRYFD